MGTDDRSRPIGAVNRSPYVPAGQSTLYIHEYSPVLHTSTLKVEAARTSEMPATLLPSIPCRGPRVMKHRENLKWVTILTAIHNADKHAVTWNAGTSNSLGQYTHVQSSVLWDITSCSTFKLNRRFEKNMRQSFLPVSCWFIATPTLKPWRWKDKFFLRFCWFWTDYRRQTPS